MESKFMQHTRKRIAHLKNLQDKKLDAERAFIIQQLEHLIETFTV